MNIPHYLTLPTSILTAITELENGTNLAPNLIHKEIVIVFEKLIRNEKQKSEIKILRLEHQLKEFKSIYPEFPG